MGPVLSAGTMRAHGLLVPPRFKFGCSLAQDAAQDSEEIVCGGAGHFGFKFGSDPTGRALRA